MRFVTAMVVFFVMGCASHPVPPSGTEGTQAAQVDAVQKQKADFERLIAQSVGVLGPGPVNDMLHLAQSMTPTGLIVFHVVTTEELGVREKSLATNEYIQALRSRIEPGLDKAAVAKVRTSVRKMDDVALSAFWAIICRVMLEQPQSPEFDAFFGALEN